MSLQTVLRFRLSVRQIFSNSNVVIIIDRYGKGTVAQISTEFGPAHPVACRRAL